MWRIVRAFVGRGLLESFEALLATGAGGDLLHDLELGLKICEICFEAARTFKGRCF